MEMPLVKTLVADTRRRIAAKQVGLLQKGAPLMPSAYDDLNRFCPHVQFPNT